MAITIAVFGPQIIHGVEIQGPEWAGINTNRLLPLLQPILTTIAFGHDLALSIQLRGIIRASSGAGLTAYTQRFLDQYQTLVLLFMHGTCGAGLNTDRLAAMVAAYGA